MPYSYSFFWLVTILLKHVFFEIFEFFSSYFHQILENFVRCLINCSLCSSFLLETTSTYATDISYIMLFKIVSSFRGVQFLIYIFEPFLCFILDGFHCYVNKSSIEAYSIPYSSLFKYTAYLMPKK